MEKWSGENGFRMVLPKNGGLMCDGKKEFDSAHIVRDQVGQSIP